MYVPVCFYVFLWSENADIAVLQLRLYGFLYEVFIESDNFFVFGVSGEMHDGVDEFAQADIAIQAGIAAVAVFFTEGQQKGFFDIEGQKIILDSYIDTPSDFSADFDLNGFDWNELICC